MEQPDNVTALAVALNDFRVRGKINHELTLAIPATDRIPALVACGERVRVSAALGASMISAFSNMNLKYNMNADQIVELAEAIIDESFEDHLSLQDVLLFLKDLVLGKRGDIGYQMDMPKFFRMFEDYRQERHEAVIAIRDEERSRYKAMGAGGERGRERIANDAILDMYKDYINGEEEA